MPDRKRIEGRSLSIIDYLEYWTSVNQDKCFSSFVDFRGNEIEGYTYSSFCDRTNLLAEYLSKLAGLTQGDRVLLVYEPGLEIIAAFVACVRLGAIPVPVAPLGTGGSHKRSGNLLAISEDCGAKVFLTTRHLLSRYSRDLRDDFALLSTKAWHTTDDVKGTAAGRVMHDQSTTLFLQYTSGSTDNPKGVVVSHENVVRNCESVTDHCPTAVCWLPQYHDMGLIGYYLFLVVTGGTTYGFSPINFLRRPALWLQMLSRVRATFTSSPNFGFEYCLRADRIRPEDLAGIDLSCVQVFMNGSEPVNATTYCQFVDRFRPYGLQPSSCVVAYGLAENTLAVTGYGRRILNVDKCELQKGQVRVKQDASVTETSVLRLVSCGRPLDGVDVRIVDSNSQRLLAERQVGEIWVDGKSKCHGYWNRPALTKEIFENVVVGDVDDQKCYLRTGDLGFIDDGELFVCGRLKDLMILHGVNYYPHDIETCVASKTPGISVGQVAVFNGESDQQMVVLVEMNGKEEPLEVEDVCQTIRTSYPGPFTLAFTTARTITKTTSGKISRSLTRRHWLSGDVRILARRDCERQEQGIASSVKQILAEYNLTGDETCRLTEAGVDSIALVSIVLELERLLKFWGAGEIADEIDGRLLQRLSVAEVKSLVTELEQSPSLTASKDFWAVIRRISKKNDDLEQEEMRRDAKLEPMPLFSNAAHKNNLSISNVLLTGPTGFFGPFLLNSLLMQTPYSYCLLIRSANCDEGMNRILTSMRQAGLLTPQIRVALDQRVRIVCGDLAQHNLGMRQQIWEMLTNETQAVIHNAASVDYVLTYDALRSANVDGTRELLRFACSGTVKEFHLISSTAIFGWTAKSRLLESDDNNDMRNLDFGYAQTKWVAEQLVFDAKSRGLQCSVYRPSFLTASGDGVASKNDVVIRLLSFMINQGVAPYTRNQVSFVPVDIAAHNLATIFNEKEIKNQTLHITADEYYNLTDVARLISQQYGYAFKFYAIGEFVAELKRRCGREDALFPLLDFFSRSHLKLVEMESKRYDNSQYRKALEIAKHSLACPSLDVTVANLMEYMLREGIISDL